VLVSPLEEGSVEHDHEHVFCKTHTTRSLRAATTLPGGAESLYPLAP